MTEQDGCRDNLTSTILILWQNNISADLLCFLYYRGLILFTLIKNPDKSTLLRRYDVANYMKQCLVYFNKYIINKEYILQRHNIDK